MSLPLDDCEQWIPTPSELKLFLSELYHHNRFQGTLDHVRQHELYIGAKSFENGLNAVLLESVRNGHLNLLQYMLKKHYKLININKLYKYGKKLMLETMPRLFDPWETGIYLQTNSLLHIAAEECHLEIVQLLIDHGADVNIMNCCGRTPVMVGIRNVIIVKCLIDLGADLSLQDKMGNTALMLSIDLRSSEEIVKLLLEHGAEPMALDKRQFTVLHHSLHSTLSAKERSIYCSMLFSQDILPSCNSSGCLYYGNTLLCWSAPTFVDILKDLEPNVSLAMKYLKPASNMLVLASNNTSKFLSLLKEALVFKQQHEICINYLPVNETYGNRKEVENVNELTKLTEKPNNKIELIYQNLITIERVSGYGSYLPISLLLDAASIFYSTSNMSKEGLKLFNRATEMFLFRVQNHQPESNNRILLRKTVKLLNKFHADSLELTTVYKNIISCIKEYLQSILHLHGHSNLVTGHVIQLADFTAGLHEIVRDILVLVHADFICARNVDCLIETLCESVPLFMSDEKIQSLLGMTIEIDSSQSFFKKFLECALTHSTQWLNTPIVPTGDYPIHLANKQVLQILLKYGVHEDVVNRDNKKPLAISSLPGTIDSLFCLSAISIVSNSIPYWCMFLPKHIKKFISYHDPNALEHHIIPELVDIP